MGGIPIRDPRHDRRVHSNMAATVSKPHQQQEAREALADTREQDQQGNNRSNHSSVAQAHELPDLLDLDNDVIVEAPSDPKASGAGDKQSAFSTGSVHFGGA